MNFNKKKVIFEELIYNNKEFNNIFSESFVYFPESFDEKFLGNLFIIGTVQSKIESRQEPVFLLNYIASEVSRSYYSYVGYSIEDALYNSLNIINKKIKNLYDKNKLFWLKNIYLIIGVYYKKELYFSIFNKASVYIIEENQIKNIFGTYIKKEQKEVFTFEKIYKIKFPLENIKILILTPPVIIDKKIFSEKFSTYINKNFIRNLVLSLNKESFAGLFLGFEEKKSSFIKQPKKRTLKPKKIKKIPPKIKFSIKFPKFFNNKKFLDKNKIIKFRKFLVKNKKFFLGIFIVIFIFGFYSLYKKNKAISDELLKADNYISSIYNFEYENKEIQRRFLNESRVIYEKYKNRKGVEEKLEEIKFLLNNLEKINKFSKIKIINFQNIDFNPEEIFFSDQNILLTDKQKFAFLDLLLEQINKVLNIFPEKNDLVGYYDEKIFGIKNSSKKIFIYDTKTSSFREYSLNSFKENIKGFDFFSDNIYFLTENGKILKFKIGDFSNYEEWLKNVNINYKPKTLGIDGEIFLLSEKNIFRLRKGKLVASKEFYNYKFLGFFVPQDIEFKYFVAWDNKFIYLISKENLEIESIFINKKIKNIKKVLIDKNFVFYILQDNEIILGFR